VQTGIWNLELDPFVAIRMNVFLIGYRGSGKTTVAAALAGRLSWPWIDADVELERRAGKSIKQIFAEQGEKAFRDLESAVVAELAAGDQRVIALGGGAVLREQNRQAIAGRGPVVWLTATPEVLFERISADATTTERRPNLTAAGGIAEIRSLLAQRAPVYQACADLVVDAVQLLPEELAALIVHGLRLETPNANAPPHPTHHLPPTAPRHCP
jgi:shikimate kinase